MMDQFGEADVRAFLTRPPTSAADKLFRKCHEVLKKQGPTPLQLLHLTADWLATFLPHNMSKVNRVSFGVLTQVDIERLKDVEPDMPRTRQLLAVPFVSMDTPARASEFAQPDIVVGLTYLGYRYQVTALVSAIRGCSVWLRLSSKGPDVRLLLCDAHRVRDRSSSFPR